ncbi:putative phosphoribosylglycinamide formyltransferase [Hyaloscypha hepaticicola]|uniref:Phosphoribosylglycinamide formyltransferase n=1 Tax=Hyaloscypha hepaticicola TaxID=2082293 RepID=A0A2J6QFQ0_9HELO|nr:putative phosphoribosylglycinamide formyltransferase [Hyaloscypha hepaticicola]
MHQPPDTKATILISGEGTNLQALIDATSSTLPHLKIKRVISNREKANGLNRARAASIPTEYLNLVKHKYHASGETDQAVKQAAREKYDADLADLVLADEPDIVICAGWMHVLSPQFLDPLAAKKVPVINLHPALPGKYDGIDAIKRAYDDYHKGKLEHDRTGIMIHYVISEVDRGQPIVVREVECRTPETLEELKTRMHVEEHTLIVEGTAMAIHNLWEARSKSGKLLVSFLKAPCKPSVSLI